MFHLFYGYVGAAIKQESKTNYDDAIILSKAAQMVQMDMMILQFIFKRTLETGCQQNSFPQSLKSLVGMIIGEPNIVMQSSNSIEAQTTLTFSQLTQFNSSICRRKFNPKYSIQSNENRLSQYNKAKPHAELRGNNV